MESKIFPTQELDEKILILLREHWLVFVAKLFPGFLLGTIGYAMILIVPIFVRDIISFPFYAPIATFLILLGWLLFFYAWFIWYLTVVVVTDRHVVDIDQRGLFHKRVSELIHENIEDVSASQSGIIQTMLDFGDVSIQTAGEIPEFEITSAPHPYEVAKLILTESSKRQGPRQVIVNQAAAPPQQPTIPPAETQATPAKPPAQEDTDDDSTSVFPL